MEQVTRKAATQVPASTPPFALEGFDHILLLVNGMKPAVQFYTDVLGCTVEGALPQYGMLRAGAAPIDLVDVSAPEAAWAKPTVAGGRNSITCAWRSACMTKRCCAGISRVIMSRSSKRAYTAGAAARACRSTSATHPATSSS